MEIVTRSTREDYWTDCVDSGKPFVVYAPRFGYGIFAYDMTSNYTQWTKNALDKIQNFFQALYDKYRGHSKSVQVQGFNYLANLEKGYIVVLDTDVENLLNLFQTLVEGGDSLEYRESSYNEDYRPWDYWPNISGVKG